MLEEPPRRAGFARSFAKSSLCSPATPLILFRLENKIIYLTQVEGAAYDCAEAAVPASETCAASEEEAHDGCYRHGCPGWHCHRSGPRRGRRISQERYGETS